MKQKAIIFTVLIGCGFAIMQIVNAQRPGAESGALEELGIDIPPAPQDIEAEAAIPTKFDATHVESNANMDRGPLLKPLDQLGQGANSVDEFMAAVEKQRESSHKTMKQLSQSGDKVVPGANNSRIEDLVLENTIKNTNDSIRVIQTEPDLVYVRENAQLDANHQAAVKRLMDGDAASTQAISPRSATTQTAFAQKLLAEINPQMASNQSPVLEDVQSSKVSDSSSGDEGLGFYPDSQPARIQQPSVTSVSGENAASGRDRIRIVESLPVAGVQTVPAPKPDVQSQNPDSVIDQLFNEQIEEVSAKVRVQTPYEAQEQAFTENVEVVNESVDLDNPDVHSSSLAADQLFANPGENVSPEVANFMEMYKAELGTPGSASIPASDKNTQYNSFETYAELENTEEDIYSGSSEIVPFIAIDDAELTSSIRQLARQAGINFIFDPRVLAGIGADGVTAVEFPKVTIRFENVTALQALEAVLDSYGLALEPNKKTRIAKVSYKRPPQSEPLESEVIQLKYHSSDEMVEIMKSFVGSRSSLQPHTKSSKIVVSATKDELEKIAELIYELDVPSKNVLITANILETSRNPKSLRGIDWSGTFQDHKFSFGNGKSTGTQSSNGGVGQNNLSTEFAGSGLSVVTGGFTPDVAFLNSDGLNAVLNFLNSDTQTRVVATPQTVTQNAIEATLEVTRAFPIFQESPGSQAVPATTTIIYTNLGTILKVTPRISADDSVTLKVRPEVSNVDGKDQTQVGGRVSEANIYAIRRMETTVRVPSGHTLVMGGLSSDTRTKKQNKVPLLGDIPVLGKLFQNKEKNQENQNLVVFITPTIVRDDDYQPSTTDFLRTKIEVGDSDVTFDSLWDSAEPHQWGKKKQ